MRGRHLLLLTQLHREARGRNYSQNMLLGDVSEAGIIYRLPLHVENVWYIHHVGSVNFPP